MNRRSFNAKSTGWGKELWRHYREGEELIVTDTGISLGSSESLVGEIEVLRADLGDGRASICKIVSGSGFKRGDVVRVNP